MGWIDEPRLPNGLQHKLTPGQERVARLAARGLGTQEIADELRISFDGARQHVRAIAGLLVNPKGLPPLKLVRRWAVQQPELRTPT